MEIYSDINNLKKSDESEVSFPSSTSRLSQLKEAKFNYDSMTLASIQIASQVDPFASSLPEWVEVPTIDAVGWTRGHRSVDIRPRLVDKSSGQSRLLDTGAQLSATCRGPEDKEDQSINLIAVNGSKIKTYGVKKIEFKINRKAYSIDAVVCDIKEDILGMDFVDKYKLGLEWDEVTQSELYLVDKKAKIKTLLKMVTVPTDLQRAARVEARLDPEVEDTPLPGLFAAEFQVACMKELENKKEVENTKKLSSAEALKIHDQKYIEMIKAHPALLDTSSFKASKPVHGVWHRIDTGDHPPCKAKRRPIIANAEKAEKGRKVWEQMAAD